MPIFEYRCESCGHKFEAILFGEQKPECPKCHTEKLENSFRRSLLARKAVARIAVEGCGQSNCCMMNGGGCGDVN